MLQHILNKDPIAPGRILYQHMSNGPNELSVLNNGAAAHPLDDPSRDLQQPLIYHLQLDSAIHIVVIQVNRGDLHIVVFGRAIRSEERRVGKECRL